MYLIEKEKGKSEGFNSWDRPSNRIQIWNWIKIFDFSACVTLKFDGWPRKSIQHLFYTASSFLHNSKAISELKVEWQSRNAQFGSKLVIIFVPCDLEIWRMTFKSIKASLLYIKLCASFQSHLWIQTWFTIRKHSIRIKISNFLSSVTYKFDGWPWKTIGHLFYATSRYVHHFKAICEFKLELQSGNGWIGVWPLWPWHLTLTFVMDITLVHGNNSWKFHNDMMTRT